MRTVEEIKDILQAHWGELAERYRVRTIALFGSYARGEQTLQSDVDLLVEFETKPDLLKFVNMEAYLEELLGVEVQLTTIEALRPKFRERVMREAIPL
jgi:predicted nucleotidyltransferase